MYIKRLVNYSLSLHITREYLIPQFLITTPKPIKHRRNRELRLKLPRHRPAMHSSSRQPFPVSAIRPHTRVRTRPRARAPKGDRRGDGNTTVG